MGFCHNDTQYGNLMLHMASDATLEAQADAEDLLDTRRSLDELPENELRSSSGGLDAALGSSPSSFKQHKVVLPQRSYRLPHLPEKVLTLPCHSTYIKLKCLSWLLRTYSLSHNSACFLNISPF